MADVDQGRNLPIMGDFKSPEINWPFDVAIERTFREELFPCITQHFIQAIRWRTSQSPSVLDLAITWASDDTDQLDLKERIGKSAHGAMQSQLKLRGLVVPDKYARSLPRLDVPRLREMETVRPDEGRWSGICRTTMVMKQNSDKVYDSQ